MFVFVESPYAGDVDKNVEYAKKCLAHSLKMGENPFASHLLYTQVLDDTDPEQRALGLEAAHTMMERADLVVFYVDLGFSSGMIAALERAIEYGIDMEVRRIL